MAYNPLIAGNDAGPELLNKANPMFQELYQKTEALGESINSLANKVIVETGTNENGSYIRFGDGTQICYGIYTFIGTVTQAAGSMFRSGSITIPSPSAFVGGYSCSYNVGQGGTDAYITAFGGQSIGQGRTELWRAAATSTEITVKIGFIYVGRWK